MKTPKNIFNGKPIRAAYSASSAEWLYAAIDVLSALTEQASYNQARKNWSTLKARHSQLTSNCSQLKLIAADGKVYMTDVLNKAGVLALAGQIKFADTESLVEWLTAFDKAEKAAHSRLFFRGTESNLFQWPCRLIWRFFGLPFYFTRILYSSCSFYFHDVKYKA